MNSVTRQMAKFAMQLTYTALPPAVLHEVRRFLLDSLGCAFAALNNEDMRAAHRYITKLGEIGRHTSELQSTNTISYAGFFLKKKKQNT